MLSQGTFASALLAGDLAGLAGEMINGSFSGELPEAYHSFHRPAVLFTIFCWILLTAGLLVGSILVPGELLLLLGLGLPCVLFGWLLMYFYSQIAFV